MLIDLFLLLCAFLVLWTGAGFAVSGVDRAARYVKISSFIVSFFVLGLLTSVSEISVAYFSVLDKTPSISVGNLIGASAVLTLLIIPLLAVINKGIEFNGKVPVNFPFAYFVIVLPVFLVLDRVVSFFDAFVLIFAYGLLAITTSVKNTILDKIEEVINHHNINVVREVLKILGGIILIVASSKYIVDTTVLYANKFSISPFLIGLVILAFGTNLPEITILIRSTILKKKAIALGDYVGSAAINSVVLGFLVLFNQKPVLINGGVKPNLLLLPLGAFLFIYFSKNKKLDRLEGAVLLGLYLLFVALEILL